MRPAIRAPLEVVRRATPSGGQVSLITGGSGSGKSTLLRAVAATSRARVMWVGAERLSGRVCEAFEGEAVAATVCRLARVGLADASVLGRRVETLSDGERFRLELAVGVWRAEAWTGEVMLACDEFTSSLDEASAWAAGATLARAVRGNERVSALVATWREELAEVLRPEAWVRCDYGAWTGEERSAMPVRASLEVPSPTPGKPGDAAGESADHQWAISGGSRG